MSSLTSESHVQGIEETAFTDDVGSKHRGRKKGGVRKKKRLEIETRKKNWGYKFHLSVWGLRRKKKCLFAIDRPDEIFLATTRPHENLENPFFS